MCCLYPRAYNPESDNLIYLEGKNNPKCAPNPL